MAKKSQLGRLRLPWLPLLVDDWLTSPTVLAMTAAERGMYVHLLAHQWHDGKLPADPELLTVLSGGSPEEWAASNAKIMRNFSLRKGWYQNRKLATLRKSAIHFSHTGKKGGQANASRFKEKDSERSTPVEARASLSHSLSSSVVDFPVLQEIKPPEVSLPVGGNGAAHFDPNSGWRWFEATYPNMRKSDEACRAWLSNVTSQEIEDSFRAALAPDGPWFGSQQWAKGVFDEPGRFIANRMDKDRPAPMRSKGEREDFEKAGALRRALQKRGLA